MAGPGSHGRKQGPCCLHNTSNGQGWPGDQGQQRDADAADAEADTDADARCSSRGKPEEPRELGTME